MDYWANSLILKKKKSAWKLIHAQYIWEGLVQIFQILDVLFIYYSILSNNWKYEEYFENFCIISE